MTTTILPRNAESLLKTDTLGRVRTSRTRRNAILDEFEGSGGSGAQFAALLGIKYPTFASWIQQRRRERAGELVDAAPTIPQTPGALRWVEARVETPPLPTPPRAAAAVGAVRIHLPGGAVVELQDPAQAGLVADLLARLAEGRTAGDAQF